MVVASVPNELMIPPEDLLGKLISQDEKKESQNEPNVTTAIDSEAEKTRMRQTAAVEVAVDEGRKRETTELTVYSPGVQLSRSLNEFLEQIQIINQYLEDSGEKNNTQNQTLEVNRLIASLKHSAEQLGTLVRKKDTKTESATQENNKDLSEENSQVLLQAYRLLLLVTELSSQEANSGYLFSHLITEKTLKILVNFNKNLLEQVKLFWQAEVGRSASIDTFGYVQKSLVADRNLMSDPGAFCVSAEFPALRQTLSNTDAVQKEQSHPLPISVDSLAALIFYQLRALVVDRTEITATQEDKKSHLAFPEMNTYTILLDIPSNDTVRTPILLKIDKTWWGLKKTEAELPDFFNQFFLPVMRLQLEQQRAAPSVKIAEQETYEEQLQAFLQKNKVVFRVNVHEENRDLVETQVAADSSTQNVPLVLNVGGAVQKKIPVHAKYAHPYIDGKVAVEEQKKLGMRLLVQSDLHANNSDNNLGLNGLNTDKHHQGETTISLRQTIRNALRGLRNKSQEDTTISIAASKEESAASVAFDRTKYQVRIDNLFSQARKYDPGLKISIHTLLSLAVLLCTQKTSLHFLEAVFNKGVAPSLLTMPNDILDTLKNDNPWTEKQKKKFIIALKLWDIDRKSVQNGLGIIPTMATAAGSLRTLMSATGKLLNPQATALVSGKDSILFSTLIGAQPIIAQENSPVTVTGFTTAIGSLYENGAIGGVETTDGTIMISERFLKKTNTVQGHSIGSFEQHFEQALSFLEKQFA